MMNKSQKLLEADVKALILTKLLKEKNAATPTIIDEFTVNRSERRVDLLYIEKNVMTAFEIKTEFDTLYRLKGQVDTYSHFFDKVIVVAATKHINKVSKQLPTEIGLWEICDNSLKIIQRGRKKPSRDIIKTDLLNLLTVKEMRNLTGIFNIKIKNMHRENLIHSLLSCPKNHLKNHVINYINARYQQSSNRFLEATKKRAINANDIELLSRYKKHRDLISSQKEAKANNWNKFKLMIKKKRIT